MNKTTFFEKLRQNGTKLQGGFSSVVNGRGYLASMAANSGICIPLNFSTGCGGGSNNCKGQNCAQGCGTTTTAIG